MKTSRNLSQPALPKALEPNHPLLGGLPSFKRFVSVKCFHRLNIIQCLQSSETFESIKRDLNELKETVQNESAVVVSNTASYVSQTMKDTITGISQTMAPDLDPEEENQIEDNITENTGSTETGRENRPEDTDGSQDWTADLTNKAKNKFSEVITSIADAFLMNRNYYEDDDQMYVFNGDKLVAIDRWQQLLAQIQTDPNTYCREPSGPPEHYESWLMTFNLIDYQRQMDHLLKTVPQMHEFYAQLVPSSLSDVEFWHRFYYRVHQLRESERKKIENKSSQTETKESLKESNSSKRLNSSVEVKVLDQNNSLFKNNQIVNESANNTIESSDLQSLNSTPESNETASDGWEKTEAVTSDEERDWVQCD